MLNVGNRVLAYDGSGSGTVISANGSEYEVQCDNGMVHGGGIADIAWNERRNRWISKEESARYGKYLRRCYR